ncbi:MAG TPA: GNAT family N-acetyltransferase [Solirubrobacterales bacterium]|nr:GNAT family N-acetyltransferase [Solirubrobacterales bacterium]
MPDVHLNLVDSSRQLFELDPGAEIESGEGWLFGAGRSSHPAISNAAFRTGDADPEELLAKAREFFGARSRGFSLWVRGGVPEDSDLIEAANSAGLKQVFEMPEMTMEAKANEPPLPTGVELRRVVSAADADSFWQIATSAYADNGFPPEIFRYYEDHSGLVADNAVAFLAELDGKPVGIAMTIVRHGVAGIYWVGTLAEARGKGIGEAVTAAAISAGFDLGVEIASLQASPMGEPVYRRMGFEAIYRYRLLMRTPPKG